MIYKHIQPSKHLLSYVKHYLLLHFRVNRNAPQLIKSYPLCVETMPYLQSQGHADQYQPANR